MGSCNSGDTFPDPFDFPTPAPDLLRRLLDAADDLPEVARFHNEPLPLPPGPTLIARHPVEYASIAGRGVVTPNLSVNTDADGVTLRLDDAKNSEFWLEIRLKTDQIAELLAQIVVQHPGYDPATLQLLKGLFEQLPRS
jgi:hypothetical protein